MPLTSKTTGAVVRTKSANWNPSTGDWLLDNNVTLSDPQQDYVWTANPPIVTPVQYKLLFTSAERVAINAAKATDAVIQDLYSILDDPRLTEVDLSLQSTSDALDYLIFKTLLTAPRKVEILTGVIS